MSNEHGQAATQLSTNPNLPCHLNLAGYLDDRVQRTRTDPRGRTGGKVGKANPGFIFLDTQLLMAKGRLDRGRTLALWAFAGSSMCQRVLACGRALFITSAHLRHLSAAPLN